MSSAPTVEGKRELGICMVAPVGAGTFVPQEDKR